MNNYLLNPIEFLLTTLVDLYIMLVMVRFLLQWLRADFYNPISQFLVKATNPPLQPLRRLIPGIAGLDMAAVVLMLLLKLLGLGLIMTLRGGPIEPLSLLLFSLVALVELAFNVFLFAIIIQAVLSWVNPGNYNPVSALLQSLTAPILAPARRLLPPISGLDLSPLIAILGLQVMKMLVIPPLTYLASL